jgi:hypothetical protein
MKKQFYSHVIEITPLHMSLDGLELDEQEKQELVQLIEKSVHHAVLDTILSELSDEHKKVLLSLVIRNEHDQAWQLVVTNIPEAEHKIRKTANTLIEAMHADIAEAKTKH